MYDGFTTDRNRIAAAFAEDPAEVFPFILRFVLATIQQQFHSVESILDEWAEMGVDAPSCWGMKRSGLEFTHSARCREVAILLSEILARPGDNRVDALDLLVSIPSINTVKAAFVAQLCGFDTVCLDTRNIALHGIENIRAFSVTPANTAKTRLAKLQGYLDLSDRITSSKAAWNMWCEIIAAAYPDRFPLGSITVSALHYRLTVGLADVD